MNNPSRKSAASIANDSAAEAEVASALQEYLAALEAGAPIPRGEFLGKYKHIAPQLLECLKSLDLVHAAASELAPPSAPSSHDASFDLHKQPLGDFKIDREIGRGGMGIVYEGVQLSLGRRVAVKILPFLASLDPNYLQRFKNEARSAAQLHHPNIVPVYAVGTERGVHYYAMQLIEGYSLADLVDRRRELSGKVVDPTVVATENVEPPLTTAGSPSKVRSQQPSQVQPRVQINPSGAKPAVPPAGPSTAADKAASTLLSSVSGDQKNPKPYYRSIVTWIKQAASALDHAHQVGIIHRDVKPANLLVDGQNNVWITDFGLALFHNDLQLTRTGDMVGTLRYMSPEQAAGDRVVLDHRVDIYGLGATLYELLTMEHVVAGKDAKSLLKQILNDEPKLPRAIDSRIPLELETIVLKSLAKSPRERYATAAQMADDLQRWLDDKPILARRPTLGERAARWSRRNPAIVASTAAFSLLACLGLLVSMFFVSRAYTSELTARKKANNSYVAETKAREAADESFREAWRAVDAFTQLSEEEFKSKPQQFRVRQRFLATALEFYNSFLDQRRDDPSVSEELAATMKQVEQLMQEMSLLERVGPLMLLDNTYVQKDLKLTATQIDLVETIMNQAETSFSTSQKSSSEELLGFAKSMEEILTVMQAKRLQQIALQQRGPFAFKTPEVISSLRLTSMQVAQVNKIIEENRPKPGEHGPGGPGDHGPGGPGRGGPDGPGGPGDRPPPGQGLFGEPFNEGRPPPPPGDDFGKKKKGGPRPGGPGSGPGFDDRGPPPGRGPGPGSGPGFEGRPPPEHEGREGFGPPDGPGELFGRMKRTVDQILQILTPEQSAKWKEMVGELFPYDLHWRPDDVLPRG